jgi:hypothetical protein
VAKGFRDSESEPPRENWATRRSPSATGRSGAVEEIARRPSVGRARDNSLRGEMRDELRRSRVGGRDSLDDEGDGRGAQIVQVEATAVTAEPVEAMPIMAEDVVMAVAVPTDGNYGEADGIEMASASVRRGGRSTEPSIVQRIAALEELVHGSVSSGTMRARVEALEEELVDEVGEGPMLRRVAALEAHLTDDAGAVTSL